MSSKNLIAELEYELISTAKLLQLVPEEKLSWKPHAKAMVLGQLAYHVAVIPGRYLTLVQDENTSTDVLFQHPVPKSRDEILNSFKTHTLKAKEVLGTVNENWLKQSWNLTKGEKAVFTLTRDLFTRLLVFNHLVHHRGQLTAYLRALDVPLPSIYGPSADEDPFV